ncbi:MAG: low molecular weight phosphotyrosine protein phosphatase [Leptolyngbya sp. PLA3]|nr:MAG: low molecular weight phosphotyrosine protein phosphatase [Cyanobacteria bacterium CYA]MCE7968185.1 low molecular weight phosphotyrosine protein phosphatase [Leptolyngbya sp. PL-A3]
MHPPRRLLFVCLGNICRSPMAEGIFIHMARQRGVLDQFEVDSCGLGGWHVGSRADPRALATAASNGVDLPSCARKFDPATDPHRFDLLLAMDASNARGLIDRGTPPEKVRLMRSFDPMLRDAVDEHGQPKGNADIDVPDPYYGADGGFELVYAMLVRACEGLLGFLSGQGTAS